MQSETKKVSKLIANKIDFFITRFQFVLFEIDQKKPLKFVFDHKFSSQVICSYVVTRSNLTEFMMLPEKKKKFPLCYLEKDVEVTVANQACNSLMCNYIESSLIRKSYCNKGQKCCEKFSLFFRNRMEIAVLCFVYRITYPRVHPLRTLASAGITVPSPSL